MCGHGEKMTRGLMEIKFYRIIVRIINKNGRVSWPFWKTKQVTKRRWKFRKRKRFDRILRRRRNELLDKKGTLDRFVKEPSDE